MPTTRSASKRQTNLEEVGLEHTTASSDKQRGAPQTGKRGNGAVANASKATAEKRKNTANQSTQPAKKSKPATSAKPAPEKTTSKSNESSHGSIVINRSPVLQLWAAVVAKFLHPKEAWESCLSIGAAISTLCTISKGRAIGKVEPKDGSTDESSQQKEEGRGQHAERKKTLDVMGFKLDIKDDNGTGLAMIGDKPKAVKEGLLQGKFGGAEAYTNVKRVMENALRAWSADKNDLDKKAFHMYEKFRPDVASGSSGWGRKGELKLDKVKKCIEEG